MALCRFVLEIPAMLFIAMIDTFWAAFDKIGNFCILVH